MSGRWDIKKDDKKDDDVKADKGWMPRHADPIPRETTERIYEVKEACRLHEVKDVTVIGVVSEVHYLHKMIKGITFTCMKCNTDYPITYEKPELFESNVPAYRVKKCVNCKTDDYLRYKEDPINAVMVDLVDRETFSNVDMLRIFLFGDDQPTFDNTRDIENHGQEIVQVTGDIYFGKMSKARNSPTLPFLYVKYRTIYPAKTELELSSEDVKQIKAFPTLVGVDNVVEELSKKFATSMIGYDHVKKGLLLCAASTSMDKDVRKLHVLLVGDPGLGKTEFLWYVTKLVPGSRNVGSQHTTAISMTAIVSSNEGIYSLRLGPIPQAKGAIAALNEIGQMINAQQGLLLDVMEEQKFNTRKYGRGYNIDSPTAIIASCNPKDGSWRGKNRGISDTDDVKADRDKIPLIGPLLDRFDIIFVFKDDRSKRALKQYAEKKSAMLKTPPPDYSVYLQKHILYAKRYFAKPELSEQAKAMLNEYYVGVRAKYASPRMLETIIRIAQTIASLKLKKTIDEKDAEETINFYNILLQELEMLIALPTRASEVAYQECLKILKGLSAPIKYSDLMLMACQANPEVKQFIGENFVLRENMRYRSVLQRLKGNSRVAQKGDNPIILEWIQDPAGGSDEGLGDQGDQGDTGSGSAKQ